MLGSVGLARAVIRRMRSDWAVNAAAAILLAAAASLLATATLYGDTVALGGIRRSIEAAPPGDRGVVVRTIATPDRVAGLDEDVGGELRRSLGDATGVVALVARSGAFAPSADPDGLTLLASFEGIAGHAELLAGSWARAGQDPVEATLSEGALAALGLAIGDRVALTSRLDPGRTIDVVVTGSWHPFETDPYWAGEVLDLRGEEVRGPFTTRGPFVVAIDDLVGHPAIGTLDLAWHGLPAPDRVSLDAVQALGASVATLPARLRGSVPAGQSITVSTGLPALLAEIDRSVLVTRGGVAVLTIQFGVLAGYAIVLVAGMIVDRRRIDVALLRSRGAGDRQLAAMAVAEAALIAVPGAIAAPFLALVVVRALAAGPLADVDLPAEVVLSGDVVLVAVLAAVVSAIALAIPAVVSAASPGAVRATSGRQATRPLGQRLGIDLAIVAIAAVALWQLHLYGSPITRNARGVLGLDPLLVAAPAIGLLAGGLLALRIVPRLAEIGERALGAGRGLVASIGARQVARRPARYTRAGLLLMLAIALGTFGAAYAATWIRSQAEQATWQAVGDVRLVTASSARVPAWAVASAIEADEAVTAATPVIREPLDFGRALAGGTLLALDPGPVGEIAGGALDLARGGSTSGLGEAGASTSVAERLAVVGADRPASKAQAIAGTPARLAVVVDVALDRPPAGPDTPDGPDLEPLAPWDAVRVTLVIEDGNGSIQRIDGGTGRSVGTGQRIEVALQRSIGTDEVAPVYPIRVRAVELRVSAPINEAVGGSIAVRGLEASDARSGDAWTPIDFAPDAPGWAWQRVDRDRAGDAVVDDQDPAEVLLGTRPDLADAVFGFATDPGTTLRLWPRPAAQRVIAGIAGTGFLEATGTTVGDTVSVTTRGLRLDVRIVDSFATMPPLAAGAAFLIVDRSTLELIRFEGTTQASPVSEWWLATSDGQATTISDELAATIRPSAVVAREAVAAELTSDPVALGLVGALVLGSLAALIFATIGYVASATVSATERMAEFTILRSIGLSNRQLSAWLAIEHAALLGFGLLAGWALGLVLAVVVLPSATFDASGGTVTPTPVVEVPLLAMAALAVLAVGLLVATATIVIRRTAGGSIGDVLRAGES